jgi:nuclear pore complex protein Nup155
VTLRSSFAGAIELPLQTASKVDPDDLALDYLRDGTRENDRRKEIYDAREECYKVVTQALGELDGRLSQATASGDGEFSPFSTLAQDLSMEDADR